MIEFHSGHEVALSNLKCFFLHCHNKHYTCIKIKTTSYTVLFIYFTYKVIFTFSFNCQYFLSRFDVTKLPIDLKLNLAINPLTCNYKCRVVVKHKCILMISTFQKSMTGRNPSLILTIENGLGSSSVLSSSSSSSH